MKKLLSKAVSGRLRSASSYKKEDDGEKQTTEENIRVQKKAFQRWINSKLSVRNLVCNDLIKDWEDGILLINLIEIVAGTSCARR